MESLMEEVGLTWSYEEVVTEDGYHLTMFRITGDVGTMQVSEQVDQLRTLGSDPVDYLVAPRVVACAVSLPILSVISFTIGMAASILLADLRYDISPNAIVDSAAKYLESSDIGIMCAKALAFGAVIATISCGWGQPTPGGRRGAGRSTPRAASSPRNGERRGGEGGRSRGSPYP